jgi:hypothetical protein
VNGGSTNRLYDLLPRIIRIRDLEEGGSLRALLQVLERQRLAVEADIERLYDDLFIETCADWVVPFLGALIDADPDATRSEVANTLRCRRRPGLPSTLVQLARDATGCAVQAKEVLPDDGPPRLDLTVYVTDAIPMWDAEAREVQPGCFTVHPLGVDTPLYRDPSGEVDGDAFVPLPLRRYDRREDVSHHVRIVAGDGEIDASTIDLADLADWARPVERGRTRLDPGRGRIAFAPGDEPGSVRVHYAYGARADIGGGPYPRGASPGASDESDWTADVDRRAAADVPEPLAHALDRREHVSPRSAVVTISDNGIHRLGHRAGERHREIHLGASESLAIAAADGCRPCLIGDLVVFGPRGAPASFLLDGCLLEGTIRVHGDVEIVVRHSTVRAPDAAAREGEAAIHLPAEDDSPSLHVAASVVGPLRLAAKSGRTEIEDSIVEAPASAAIGATVIGDVPDGHELSIRRSTILGPVRASHARTAATSRRVGVDRDSRFGEPHFPGPRHLRIADIAAEGLAATGALASNPAFRRLARLAPLLEEHLPLDTEARVILA